MLGAINKQKKKKAALYISVILPVRNEEKYINECLQALASQDYPAEKYEVIVVDGMSDDQTRPMIKSYCDLYSNFQMVDNPKQTTPAGLNIALGSAEGDVLVRVDGHAVIASDYLTQCVHHLNKTGADCVCGTIYSIQTNLKGKAIALGMSSVFGVGNARFRTSGTEGYVDTGAFLAYRREVFDKVGVFHENLIGCEDDEFHYRLRSQGGRIFFTPMIRSKYYTRTTYRELLKQYYRYGYAKVNVLKLHPRMMQLRQFVPPCFVLVFVLSFMMFPFVSPVFLFIPTVYIAASLLAAIVIGKRRYAVFLLFVFFCLHFGYGIGFIISLIRRFVKDIRSWAQFVTAKLKVFLHIKAANTK